MYYKNQNIGGGHILQVQNSAEYSLIKVKDLQELINDNSKWKDCKQTCSLNIIRFIGPLA